MITEVKNQLESLKAINKIRGKIKNLVLVLAGTWDESYKAELDEYVKENKLGKHVLFTGNLSREELRNLYSACDVGIFPVGKQGGGLAPFEVLCAEKPVIVSENLGTASVIKENNLGIVTKEYASVLLDISKNKKDYKKWAKDAARFVKENLGWDVFTDKMVRAFEWAIKEN